VTKKEHTFASLSFVAVKERPNNIRIPSTNFSMCRRKLSGKIPDRTGIAIYKSQFCHSLAAYARQNKKDKKKISKDK